MIWPTQRNVLKVPANIVREFEDRVEFAHVRGMWLQSWILILIWCCATLYWLSFYNVTDTLSLQALILIPGILAIGAAWRAAKAIPALKGGIPVLIVFDNPTEDGNQRNAEYYVATEIEGITVQETGSGLFQVWLKIRDRDSPILSLQRQGVWRKQVLRIAARLGSRWRVPVRVKLQPNDNLSLKDLSPFLAIVGIVLLLLGLPIMNKQIALQSWPSTQCTILSFDLGIVGDVRKGEAFDHAVPRIEYEYTVNGVTYRAQHINPFGFSYSSQKQVEEFFRGFAPGVQRKCWYNPRNHAEAYILNFGVTPGPVVIIGIGGSCLGLAVLGGLRKGRSD